VSRRRDEPGQPEQDRCRDDIAQDREKAGKGLLSQIRKKRPAKGAGPERK